MVVPNVRLYRYLHIGFPGERPYIAYVYIVRLPRAYISDLLLDSESVSPRG